jgi:threonine/homoserine/homoserine lactone efflux protein
MLGTHDLALFVISGLLLNITPGPDTLYIVGRSTQGLRSGAVAALGIGAGCFVHIFAAAIGLSALLAASATAFSAVKLVGGAYLVWIGISMLLTRTRSPAPGAPAAPPLVPLRRVFMQGFLTNALNPKVALFFLALLPQFIDAGAASKPLAFLFLGIIFNTNALAWNLFVAWSAAKASRRLRDGRATLWVQRVLGALFVWLGLRLVLDHHGSLA